MNEQNFTGAAFFGASRSSFPSPLARPGGKKYEANRKVCQIFLNNVRIARLLVFALPSFWFCFSLICSPQALPSADLWVVKSFYFVHVLFATAHSLNWVSEEAKEKQRCFKATIEPNGREKENLILHYRCPIAPRSSRRFSSAAQEEIRLRPCPLLIWCNIFYWFISPNGNCGTQQ